MKFELFIARRYLSSKRKTQFVSVISLISIVGITVGVASLLIILSVFNGFTGVVTSILVNFDPHIRIIQKGGISSESYLQLEKILTEEKNLKYAPFISGKAMIISESRNRVVFLKGVNEKIANVSGLKDKIVLGKFDLGTEDIIGNLIIGFNLADRLGVIVGDEVEILSPYAISSIISPFTLPLVMKFKIAGIYESNNKEYDGLYAFASLNHIKKLLGTEKYSGVDIRLDDISKSEKTKRELSKLLGSNFEVATWYDLHADLYSMMKIERWIAYILLCLIIIVASFNLIGSLYMTVLEKRRDIGVLQSMGASKKSIIRIFMFEGVLIGLIGNFLGIVIGLSLVYVQMEYHIFKLDPTVYILPAIPVEVKLIDFVYVSLAAMILTTIASYLPAKQAARVIPIETIRWE